MKGRTIGQESKKVAALVCVVLIAFPILAISVQAVTPTYVTKFDRRNLGPNISAYIVFYTQAGANDKDWSVTFEVALCDGAADAIQGAMWTGYVYDSSTYALLGRWADTEKNQWHWDGYGVHSGTVSGHAANKALIALWILNIDTKPDCYDVKATASYW